MSPTYGNFLCMAVKRSGTRLAISTARSQMTPEESGRHDLPLEFWNVSADMLGLVAA